MDGFISLTIFTVLAQAAAGMAMLMALCPHTDTEHKYSPWIMSAVVLLGVGTIASVFHLNDPLKAVFALSNFTSSRLTYEIYAVIAFGLSLLVALTLNKVVTKIISGVLGAALVYVMSDVYMLTSSAPWESMNTLVNFYTSAFLSGSVCLFAIKMLASSDNFTVAMGCGPKIIAIAVTARAIAVALLVRASEVKADIMFLDLHLTLSCIAAVLLPIMLLQSVAKVKSEGKKSKYVCCLLAMMLFILAGEMSGRMMFYMLYTNFGM